MVRLFHVVMKIVLSIIVIILFFEGCDSSNTSYPVQPDFIAPHIVAASVFSDSLEVVYTFPQSSFVTVWIVKGIGPGETDDYLDNYGAGEFFVSKMLPTKVLVNEYLPYGMYRVVWDTKDENGQFAEQGYYRLYFRAGTFYQYKDLYLQK